MGFNTFPCNPYPISTEELNKGNNDDLNTRVAALESDVSDLNSNKANQITIAPFFSEETAYTAGDLVYYNGLSYRCTNDHEGAWDADDFAATTISNELDSLKSGLTNLVKRERLKTTTDMAGDFNFVLKNNGILVSVRPLRSTDHYNSWWGAIIASTVNNTGYSCKAIKDDGTALTSQSVLLDVYYI